MFRIRVHATKRCLLALVFIALPLVSGPREITVAGTAVAISNSPGLQLVLNGFVHTEIIVRVEKPKELESKFIRIMLSIPESQYDKWKDSLASLNKFRIIPRPSDDGLLKKSVPLVDVSSGEEIGALPVWKSLSGREEIPLPFDQLIMAFESIDWPDVPIV
jgi:hypothetical protein